LLNKYMRIELFGLPGSGKTFFAGEYKERYNIPVISLASRKEKYGYCLLFFLNHPYITLRLLFWIVSETLFNLRLMWYKIDRLFFSILAREQKAQGYEAFILDEGFLQLLLSIPESPLYTKDVSFLVSFLRKRNIEIHILKTDKAIRYERMEERKGKPRSAFGGSYIEWWYPILEGNFEIATKIVTDYCSHKTITT